jgi:hypothetical protein
LLKTLILFTFALMMKPLLVLFFTCSTTLFFAQSYNFYFGNIHAHSGYSDGNKDSLTSGMYTPYQDFLYANESEHIDFYGISEHNHSAAGMASKQNYYNGVADAELATIEDTFIAMYGMEWGIISQGGHVLIYGYDSLIGWENNLYDEYVQPTDFQGLWNVINSKPNCFGYLAHPSADDFDSLLIKPWDFNADQAVVGMPFRSGPAFSQNFTYSNPSTSSYWSRYTQLLKQGYHVGIGLDHDTHYSVFGRSQQGRMGLLAPNLTKNDMMYALRKMHFYSTDDWNFRPDFRINEQPMGSIIEQAGNPTIFIDCIDLDLSEPINYISIYYGVPGSGQQATLLTQVGAQNTVSYNHPIQNGETYYYYARIVQLDGDEIFTSPIWYTRNDGQTEVVPAVHFSVLSNPVCVGEPVELTYDGTAGNNSYFWSFSAGVTPEYATQANPQVTFTQAGTYHATLYVENSAGSGFYTMPITVEGCAGVLDHGLGYKIYPNPATTQLTIEVDVEAAIEEIALIDAMGRMVLRQTLENQGKNTLDISAFPSGMYVIQLLGSTKRITESLWIQK